MTDRRRRVGFTLVELLVVIAIIGILIALLLPAVQAAREAARRSQCSNNSKQIGLALHNYHDAHRMFPMALFTDTVSAGTFPPNANGSSWGLAILPYMEQQPLYDQFDHRFLAVTLLSPGNVAVIATPVAGFVCPSAPGGLPERAYDGDGAIEGMVGYVWPGAAPSDYMATEILERSFRQISDTTITEDGIGVLQEWGVGVFTKDNRIGNIAGIKDGTSNTFIIGERTGGNAIYNKNQPADLTGLAATLGVSVAAIIGGNGGGWGDVLNGECDFDGALFSGIDATGAHGSCAINCTSAREYGFHSFHPGGATFTMADGSVKFVSETITPALFSAQYTRDGGEVLQ